MDTIAVEPIPTKRAYNKYKKYPKCNLCDRVSIGEYGAYYLCKIHKRNNGYCECGKKKEDCEYCNTTE